MQEDLPNIEQEHLKRTKETISQEEHRPRILLLYGSLRERSYSRFVSEEAGRLLRELGGRNTHV